jgi:hypothetical protein
MYESKSRNIGNKKRRKEETQAREESEWAVNKRKGGQWQQK